jgi:CRP-like cAMP-binding protein
VKMERVSPDGVVTIVEILGPGSPLAAANFLEQVPYPVTAVALSDLTYGTLSYRDFEACVRRHPEVALTLLSYLARRLHRAYEVRRPIARSHVRLADALHRIASDAPREEGGVPVIGLSHGDLAEVAGMARETVTRHLRRWQEAGIVDLGLRAIRVRNLDALRRLAEEPEEG